MKRHESARVERVGWRAEDENKPGPHRSRKNRKRWCRGKTGVEHEPLIIEFTSWAVLPKGCGTSSWSPSYYVCFHRERCATCRRIMRHSLDKDCPDHPNNREREAEEST